MGRFGGQSLVYSVDRKIVALVNTRTVRSADRYVYSPRDDLVYLRQDGNKKSIEGALLDLMAE